MAIPITCPGCKAGFEVPETLAGKTIRCTSCKTQLSVPTAVAQTANAPSGAGKKPFGWAGAATTDTKPAAEPLPLDDDDTPPPSRPAAPTKPAAKPAAKPMAKPVTKAAVHDDDDDDANTKSKPSKKPAAKASAAAKNRRNDDDDDDDDDDDRPQRRKRREQQGASGAMIALIAGGVLALAGIAVGCYFLLSDDKKETAKSDTPADTGGAAATPPPGGGAPMPGAGGRPGMGGGRPGGSGGMSGPPGGMPGGPGMPGGGMPGGGMPGGPGGGNPFAGLNDFESLGTEGAWANFSGDGFSAEFPGTPETKTTSQMGVPVKIAGVGRKGGKTVMAIHMQLPSAPAAAQVYGAMESQINRQGNMVVKNSTVGGIQAKEVIITEGGGSGVLRYCPVGDRLYMFIAGGDLKNGQTTMPQESITRFMNSIKFSYQAPGGNVAGGGVGGFPGAGGPGRPPMGGSSGGPPGGFPGRPPMGGFPGPGGGFPPTPGAGGGVAGGMPPGMGGGMGDMPGFPPTAGMGGAAGGMGGAGDPGMGGGVAGPMQPPGAGGGVAGMPGMGGGAAGPMFPPTAGGGGQPGRPPAGGAGFPGPGGAGFPGPGGIGGGGGANEVPGNLKGLLKPFFAGAFDTEKKELILIGVRPVGSRQAGTIMRYSYPSLQVQGTTNIHSVATRAVVDSKKGLLYVTTVSSTPPPTLMQDQADFGAYPGEVVVYDLAQVRATKGDEKTDLKPLGTMSFGPGKIIRDIALDDAGKALFVLTLPTNPKSKSQVHLMDTATRKSLKTKELPDRGWRMIPTPDGKKLIVAGLPSSNPAENPLIMVLDQGDLTPGTDIAAPKPFPFDLAVAKDGRIVASSGTGQGNNELRTIDAAGVSTVTLSPGVSGLSNQGHVGITPDGKYLVVSSHHPAMTGGGLDVYETTDKTLGEKKVASMRKATDTVVGGTFLLSPDSDFIVFYNGAVLKFGDLGGSTAANSGAAGGGVPGAPGGGVAGGMGGEPGVAPPGAGGGGGIAPPGAGNGMIPPGMGPGGAGLPGPGGVGPGAPGRPPGPGGFGPGAPGRPPGAGPGGPGRPPIGPGRPPMGGPGAGPPGGPAGAGIPGAGGAPMPPAPGAGGGPAGGPVGAGIPGAGGGAMPPAAPGGGGAPGAPVGAGAPGGGGAKPPVPPAP